MGGDRFTEFQSGEGEKHPGLEAARDLTLQVKP
jgi:hypothetical protein